MVVDPLRPLPVSSTTNTRSASPSKASPRSKPPATTRARRSRWFAGCSGSAGWFGNVPSSSANITSSSTPARRSNTAGTTRPPMPLAVSATTFIEPISARSMKLSDVLDERRSSSVALGALPQVAACRRAAAVEHLLRDRLHLGQTGVDADRTSTGEAQLDAVVAGGVVRGGEHRAGQVERPRRVVHQIGRGEPDVDDVDAVLDEPAGERLDQRRPRRAHVAGDDHRRCGADERGESDPEGVGHVGVELVGNGAADVVRLDDGSSTDMTRRDAIGRGSAGDAVARRVTRPGGSRPDRRTSSPSGRLHDRRRTGVGSTTHRLARSASRRHRSAAPRSASRRAGLAQSVGDHDVARRRRRHATHSRRDEVADAAEHSRSRRVA